MGLQFTSRRSAGAYFQRRVDYIENRGRGGGSLCHSIGALKGNHEKYGWTTLLLGSGCLEALDGEDRAAMSGLAEGVVAHFDRHPGAEAWFDGDAVATVRNFVGSLVRDRVDPGYLTDTAPPADVDAQTADLALCAALLTRLYHSAKVVDVTAITRAGGDVARIDTRSVWWQPLHDTLAVPALELAEAIQGALPDGDHQKPVERLLAYTLDAIGNTLTPTTPGQEALLALWHVSLLTECAWYFLTRETSVYPGWGDLLLALAVEHNVVRADDLGLVDRNGVVRARSGIPRPTFATTADAADAVRDIFLPAARVSWERRRHSNESADRSSLYASCAELLREQAQNRVSRSDRQLPPVASAFVTTFDLELETALLRHPDPSPFLIVLPFSLLVGSRDDRRQATSHPVWLARTVQPGVDALDDLLEARDDWFILRESDVAEVAVPVVVRLSGCPLIAPPRLYDVDNRQWQPLVESLLKHLGASVRSRVGPPGDDPDDPGLILEHAVVLDEYAAMEQSAVELYSPPSMGHSSSSSEAIRFGLPVALTSDTRKQARFWTLLGVQVSDAGMRHRVAFQITSPRLTSQVSHESPERMGLLINRRVSSEDQELLHWFGFDIVQARCQDFVEDLHRIALHHALGGWHSEDRQCEVSNGRP